MGDVMLVFGTRPEAIKLAPVIRALHARSMPARVCVTGQHRDLLDDVLGMEGITPDIDLDLMQPGQSVADLLAAMLGALHRVFVADRPGRVIVQGDTASAAAAAQAAFLAGIPVAHVEAGLRTGRLNSPHPEEGFRRLITTFADMHFAPTAHAAECLEREGVPPASIHMTGNTSVDALLATQTRLSVRPSPLPELAAARDRARGKRLLVVTCHRRENIAALGSIADALRLMAQRSDVLVVLPAHPNPVIRAPLVEALRNEPNVMLLDALKMDAFVALLADAHLVLTDSGGVQEEAPMLGTPVLVLRDTTERPESVDAGTAVLVGTNTARIVSAANHLLDNPLAHARMARRHSPFGDGRAAERIADIIAGRQSAGLRIRSGRESELAIRRHEAEPGFGAE